VKAHKELELMALNPATYSTRSLSLLMFAAFAGVAIWLFAPYGFGAAGNGGSGDASAALPSSLKVDGPVQVETHENVVTHLVVPLAVRGTKGLTLDGSAKLRAETAMSDTASAAVPATYALSWLDGNGDDILDPGEHAILTVDLPATSTIHPGNPLNLVITAADGSALVIEDVLAI
jgi:hypothetical protein